MSVNVVDLGILVFILVGLWHGWRRGLLALVISIVGFIIAYVVALKVNQPVAGFLETKVVPVFYGGHAPPWPVNDYRVAALLLVLIIAEAILGSLAGPFGANRLRIPVLGAVNRLLGAVVGGLEYLLLASILLFILAPVLGVHSTFGTEVAHSAFFQQLMQRWEPSYLKSGA